MVFEKWDVGVVVEKQLSPIVIASIRWCGSYADTGKYFGKLYRGLGPNAAGKPFNLYYDEGYKPENADIESCVEMKKEKLVKGAEVRTLPAGRAVTLIHQGPYDCLHESYEKLFGYLKERGYTHSMPIRELYHKGPGMLLKGNPKKYITELQVMVTD